MRSLFLTLLLPLAASAAPLEIAHQGRLLDSTGSAVDGAHDVTVRIYDESGATTAVWEDTFSVTLDNGFYGLVLGSGKALEASAFADDSLWVGIELDSDGELTDRIGLSSVPYALNATNVSGGVVNASDLQVDGNSLLDSSGNIDFTKIGGLPAELSDGDNDTLAELSCSDGQLIAFNGTTWACADGASGEISADAITSGQLAIERIPVGTSDGTVAAGNHSHDAASITGILTAQQLPIGTRYIPALSCQELADQGGHATGTYWINPRGTGSQQVQCNLDTDGEGWIDLVATFHLPDADGIALGVTFFDLEIDDPGSSIFTTAATNDDGEPGILIIQSDNDHSAGFYLKPGFIVQAADMDYRMQGSDEDYRCGNGNWIPLSGPGYDGGHNGYLVSCPAGYSCIQGTPTGSRDEPIQVSYSNSALKPNELLTWSGSDTGDFSRNCARDPQIPSDVPATFFTKLLIR